MNLANIMQATEMMAQGMIGIFVVLGIIALTVAALGKIDSSK